MPGTSSINGIISGLSTDEIVSKIMEVARQPVTRLTTQQTDLTQKLTAWQEFNTRLLALQTKATVIASPLTFASNSVTSSDDDIITGTATTSAATGTYFVNVSKVAQTQQLSSQGFANITDVVGTGTVHFTIDDGTTFDVTVDGNNNSLAGLRDAINKADKGVSAVIINSGDPATPYKLLVTTKGSGTGYEMTIDTSELAGGIAPVIDQVVQAAQDAELTLGSGAGKITVTKSTNTITDLIPGVTLSLKDADAGKTITVRVATDTEAIVGRIRSFVEQYNNAIDFLNSQFTFDMEGNAQGVLFGDFTLQTVQAGLSGIIVRPSEGLNQELKALSQVGITMETDGRLSIDTAELTEAISDKLPQVNALFSTGFDSTNANVTYFSSTAATKASPLDGYDVSVTTPALRAQITTAVAQNDVLDQTETLTLNGKLIVLNAGLTQAQVVAKINEFTRYTGVTALATGADGTGTGSYLTLRHTRYGDDGHITVKSNVSSAVGDTSGIGTTEVTETNRVGESGAFAGNAGQDMVGTINGIAARADGQYLIGDDGPDENDPAEGLRLKIDSSVPLTTTVHFTKGVGLLVKDYIVNATASKGAVTSAQDTINTEIDDIKEQIETWNDRLTAKETKLYLDFQKMEDALGKLQSQGSTMAALLNGLQSSYSSKK